jgi:type 2 lantibiotic biosynthesis protein LanM
VLTGKPSSHSQQTADSGWRVRSRMTPPGIFVDADPVVDHETASGLYEDCYRLAKHFAGELLDRGAGSTPLLVEGVLATVGEELASGIAQTICVEINIARIAGVLVGDSAQKRYRSYFEGAVLPEYRKYLYSKYPVLHERITAVTSATAALFERIAAAAEADAAGLSELFGTDIVPEVSDITPLGDPHDGGARACRVRFSDGHVAMYKPRSAAPELFMTRLTSLLSADVQDLVRVATVLDRGTYHWSPWLEADKNTGFGRTHYTAAGAWIAFAYFTATRDLHRENLLPYQGCLVGIDLECILNSVPTNKPGDDSLRTNQLSSVLTTGILPQRIASNADVEGVNIGAIGAIDGDVSGLFSMVVTDDCTDVVRVGRQEGVTQDQRTADVASGVAANLDAVLDGFERCSADLRANLPELVSALYEYDGHTRVVVRPTQVYFESQFKATHPRCLVDSGLARKTLGDQLHVVAPYGDDAFLQREVDALYRMQIPAYYCDPRDHSLPGPVGDIPLASGLATALERTAELRDWNANSHRHRDAIAKCIAAFGSAAQTEVGRYIDLHELLRDEDVDHSATLRLLDDVFGEIRESRAAIAPSAWMNVGRAMNNRWSVALSDHGLYGGVAGVYLAAAVHGAGSGSPQALKLAADLQADLIAVCTEDKVASVDSGAFGGIAGIAFAIGAGIRLGLMTETVGRSAINRIASMCLDKLSTDVEPDVIGGAAGCLLVFSELLRVGLVSRELGVVVCDASVEELLRRSRRDEGTEGLVWDNEWAKTWLGGASHGVAGVEWAAARYLSVANTAERKAHASQLFVGAKRSQDALWDSAKQHWSDRRSAAVAGDPPMQAWCHGAEGIILARFDYGAFDSESRRIDALRFVADLPVVTNTSLCHGMAGRMTALNVLLAGVGEQHSESVYPASLSDGMLAALVTTLSGRRAVDATNLELWNEGLMTGRSGIALAISQRIVGTSDLSPLVLRLGTRP